ncbi:MAG: gamma-glutamylcyclotransferase family protein [Myxococcales bacterium]
MTVDAPEQQLFVYGSLKRGHANHAQLGRASFLALARTRPLYALRVIDGYPALVPGQRAVLGELYRIAALDLLRLDEFEGDGYRRVPVELDTGERALGYVARVPSAGVAFPGDEWPAA